MITGINHITLAVSDLSESIGFYKDILGCKMVSLQRTGAYFCVGQCWLCLYLDPKAANQDRCDYTHIAFSLPPDRFCEFEKRLSDHCIPKWKENQSEGRSVYFLDPDGHKLEVHHGTLESRLAAMVSKADQ